MSVQPVVSTRPEPVRRTWLVAAVAAIAGACVVAAVLVLWLDGGAQSTSVVPPSAQPGTRNASIFSLTPMRLASGALGSGYALPPARPLPSVASVLASMDPQTRRYTEAIMALTFEQLAAGAAGQP
jgi:hypothetical protein